MVALLENLIGTPYEFSLDTTSYPEGGIDLVSYAYDAANNEGVSSLVRVIVDRTLPLVAITQPLQGSIVKGRVYITANATDNGYVKNMLCYANRKTDRFK